MILVLEMVATILKAKIYSQLVTNQVSGQYQTKEPLMIKYLHKLHNLSSCFLSFKVEHIPHEHNLKAYILSKLATSKVVGFDRTVIQETAASRDTEAEVLYS